MLQKSAELLAHGAFEQLRDERVKRNFLEHRCDAAHFCENGRRPPQTQREQPLSYAYAECTGSQPLR